MHRVPSARREPFSRAWSAPSEAEIGQLGPRWVPVVLPVLVAAGLTLPFLGSSPLWADEVDSVSAALRPLPALVRLLHHQDAPLGAYYLALHGWTRIAGTSASALRLPSALAVLVAVALTAWLGHRIIGPAGGLVAGLLLATNPFVLSFGTNARPYALALAAAVGAMLLVTWAPEAPGRLRRLTYAGVVVIGMYAHLFFGLVVLAQLLGLLLCRRPLRPWLLPVALAALTSSPLLLLAARQTAEVGYLHRPGLLSLPGWLQAMAGGQGWLVAPAVLVLLAALPAGLAAWRRHGLLAAWLVVPGPILLLVSLVHPLYLNRYVLESAPALSLLLALCLIRRLGRPGPALAVALIALSAATSASTQGAAYRYEDLRAATDAVLDRSAPGDASVLLPATVRTAVDYYLRRVDPGAVRPTDLLAAPGQGEDVVGNFGGHELPPGPAVRTLLAHRTIWLIQYADPSATRGPTAHAVLAALGRCFRSRPFQRFGEIEVVQATATARCGTPSQPR